MNTVSNYQIIPGCKTYFNNAQSKSRTQNSAKMLAVLNSTAYCPENSANLYKTDNIAFKSSLNRLRLKEAAETIFDRSIVFGPEEYKKLSSADISTLREYKKEFLDLNENNFVAEFITKFGKLFSERLHEKFPNGFTFVSLGRSPAFLAKYLEFQGEDVKYCPFSNMQKVLNSELFSPYFAGVYKKYLEKIGLTKELIQTSQKPTVITDYTYEGYSLLNFKKLLALPKIGITEGEKVKFCPITLCNKFEKENSIFNHDPYDDCADKTKRWKFSDQWYVDVMEYSKTKWYTAVPYLDVYNFRSCDEDILNRFYQNGNKFEENFDTKMMNFIIADSIHNDRSNEKILWFRNLIRL